MYVHTFETKNDTWAVSCSKATLAQGSWIAAGLYVSMFMEYAFTPAINHQGLFP